MPPPFVELLGICTEELIIHRSSLLRYSSAHISFQNMFEEASFVDDIEFSISQ